ncbi:putative transcription antitermination factor NusB [Bacteriovorax sp. BSW11_IV]|nr:putative transcription antitermination factor NusB [Bacteriovorax sp. BSW11_IV]
MNEFSDLRDLLHSNIEAFKTTLEEFDTSYIERDKEHPENDLTPNIKNFGTGLIQGAIEKLPELKDKIAPFLNKRTFTTLEKVDATILLLAVYEMTYMTQTPKNVVINEAVEMAKKFGGAESSKFINAVLDKISKN